MQIAVVNLTKGLSDLDVELMAEACNAQVVEAAGRWGIAPTPVVFYAKPDGLPAVECRLMAILDSLDIDQALGYHNDVAGSIYGKVLNQGPVDTCTTLSHECLEMLIDPTCLEWRPFKNGMEVAYESCDPVQADSYAKEAEVAGIKRDMVLSNYILPDWFNAAGVGPFDRMGKLSAPMTMSPGGYLIVRDRSGNESNVFAMTRPGDAEAKHHLASKIMRPGSRTTRRLRQAA